MGVGRRLDDAFTDGDNDWCVAAALLVKLLIGSVALVGITVKESSTDGEGEPRSDDVADTVRVEDSGRDDERDIDGTNKVTDDDPVEAVRSTVGNSLVDEPDMDSVCVGGKSVRTASIGVLSLLQVPLRSNTIHSIDPGLTTP